VAPASTDAAIFYTCTIPCTTSTVTVALKHWASQGVSLQVCERDSFQSSSAFTNCQTLPTAGPGPDTVTLPQNTFFDIVIVATGFQAGSGVAIDDIQTTYSLCPPGSTTPPPGSSTPGPGTTPAPGVQTTPPPGACKLACGFEAGNTCAYKSLTGVRQGGNKKWQVKAGPFGNPDTGVPHAGKGTKYLGVRLAKKGDKAVLFGGPLVLRKKAKLRFLGYEATKNCILKVCVDSQNKCPWSSNPGVDQSDRQWKRGEVPINAGSHKVYIIAYNKGNDICYVGFDDFQVKGGGAKC